MFLPEKSTVFHLKGGDLKLDFNIKIVPGNSWHQPMTILPSTGWGMIMSRPLEDRRILAGNPTRGESRRP